MASASEVLESLPKQLNGNRISVKDLLDEMNGRSLLLTILVLTVPNLIPFVNALGITQVTGVLLLIFTVRMMIGIQRPWLPKWLLSMQTRKASIQSISDKAVPFFKKVETFIRPRLQFLARGKAQHVFYSLILFTLTVVMLLPMPFFNVIPALVMTLIIIGLIQRDGLTSALGAIMALMLITALVYGISKLGSEFITSGFFDENNTETFTKIFL